MGDLMQILHIAIIVLVLYNIGRDTIWWLSRAWIFTVVSTNLACDGCPITMLSNFYLRADGHEEYPNLQHWIASYVGMPNAIAITVACIVIPFFVGRITTIRERKVTSTSLLQSQL